MTPSRKLQHLICLAVLALTACAGPRPSPTPVSATPTQTARVPTVTAPATTAPSQTPSPTLAQSATPTATVVDRVISTNNAGDMVELARLGNGRLSDLAWSPDGSVLAAATSIGIYLYAADTQTQIAFLDTGATVSSLAFSPDGKTLAAGEASSLGGPILPGVVRLWDMSTGQPRATLTGHAEGVNDVAFHPDEAIVASASHDGTIMVWNSDTGELLHTLKGENRPILALAVSPQGLIASGNMDGHLQLWSANGEALTALPAAPFPMMALAFSPDGQLLASGGNNYGVSVWDVQTEQRRFRGSHDDIVNDLTFSPDGLSLASASDDGLIKVWDAANGELRLALAAHTPHVTGLAYAPSGHILASAGDDGVIRLWDTATNAELAEVGGFAFWFLEVDTSSDGGLIAAARWGGVDVWDTQSRQRVAQLDTRPGWVASLAFSNDGRWLAAGGCGQVNEGDYCILGELTVWDTITYREVITLAGHTQDVRAVAFSPDSSWLASVSHDGSVILWAAGTWQTIYTIGEYIDALAFSPVERQLLTDALGTIGVWDLTTGGLLSSADIDSADSFVLALDVSPDGSTLALGTYSHNVLLWSLADRAVTTTLQAHASGVNSVAFSPARPLLASGDWGGAVYVWSLLDPEDLRMLNHTDVITGLTWSADGKLLISSSFDGTVRIWGIGL